MQRLTSVLFGLFDLDRRSVFAFRFLLGLGLLLDLSNRFANRRYFYSEAGILPEAIWANYYGNRAYYWTVHFMGGSDALVTALLLLQIALALCLMTGYRPQLVSALGWFFMLSLVLRNPLLHYGGDKLAPLLLLISAFLPRTSPAAWTAARTRAPLPTGLAFAALSVQMAVLYIVSGQSKLASRAWQDGSALGHVLDMNLLVRPLGRWLDGFGPLLELLSRSVPWAEMLLPLLLIVPLWRGRVRGLAVLALLGLNLGIQLTLDVGYFMYYASAGLVGLLPAVVWDELGRGWSCVRERLGERAAWPFPRPRFATRGDASRTPYRPPWMHAVLKGTASSLLVLLIGTTLATGLEAMRLIDIPFSSRVWTLIRSANAYQNWGLFTQPGNSASWYVSKARLGNGRWVDLLQEGGVVDWTYRELPNALYRRNSKWRLAMAKINSFGDNADLRRAFGDALVARWDRRHGPGERVESLTVYKLGQRLPIDPAVGPDWTTWLTWSR